MKNQVKLLLGVALVGMLSACDMDTKKNENQIDTTMAGANNTDGATNHDTARVDTAGKPDTATHRLPRK